MSHRPHQFYLTYGCHEAADAVGHYLTIQYARDIAEAVTFAMARLDYPCPTQGMLLSSPRAKRVLAQWFKPSYIRALVKDPYLSRWFFTTEVVHS